MISSKLKLYLYLNVLNLFIYFTFSPFKKKVLRTFLGETHPAAQQFPWGSEANTSRLPRYWRNFKVSPGLAQCRDSIRAPISGSGMQEIHTHSCSNSVSHNPGLPAWRAEEEPAGCSPKQHVNRKSSVDTLDSKFMQSLKTIPWWQGLCFERGWLKPCQDSLPQQQQILKI